jgi:hypothetical protein
VQELELLRRGTGVLLAACVATVAIAGLIDNHRRQGFYVDARGVAAYVRTSDPHTDPVIAPSEAGIQLPLLYYGLRPDWNDSWQAAADLRQRTSPLWVIYKVPATTSAGAFIKWIGPLVGKLGYRPLSARVFPGVIPLAVVRMIPLTPRPALSRFPSWANPA